MNGFIKRAEFGLIEIYGPDAEQFLQAQTSSDVKALKPHCGQVSALLDRKAHVQGYFTLFRKNTSYRIVCEESQIERIAGHLERFHFADKVEFIRPTGGFFALFGSEARLILAALELNAPNKGQMVDGELAGIHVHVFATELSVGESYLIYTNQEHLEELQTRLEARCFEHRLEPLSRSSVLEMRIEAGLASYGKDFDENTLLFELGPEDPAISYSKGCYQGQEVLARVKAQGSPSRQLTGLIFDFLPSGDTSSELFPPGTTFFIQGNAPDNTEKEAGTILSNVYSHRLQKGIALAMVKREFRAPGEIKAFVNGITLKNCRIVLLPFVDSDNEAKDRAAELYNKALQEFAKDEPVQAISKLRQALVLDPTLEDAYEALGVMLSKQGDLDEAIGLMQTLLKLNKDSVMAWANLSVFYLEQGDKEKAEEAKAESMSIRMRLAAREAMQEKKAQEDAAKLQAETRERMNMFSQVIEIDPDDLFANHGLGSCHNLLGNYKEAEQYLLKAIEIKPGHTVAYLELGNTYEGLNDLKKAREIYLKGIEVAAKKGDMTPLKAMQARLDLLETSNV